MAQLAEKLGDVAEMLFSSAYIIEAAKLRASFFHKKLSNWIMWLIGCAVGVLCLCCIHIFLCAGVGLSVLFNRLTCLDSIIFFDESKYQIWKLEYVTRGVRINMLRVDAIKIIAVWENSVFPNFLRLSSRCFNTPTPARGCGGYSLGGRHGALLGLSWTTGCGRRGPDSGGGIGGRAAHSAVWGSGARSCCVAALRRHHSSAGKLGVTIQLCFNNTLDSDEHRMISKVQIPLLSGAGCLLMNCIFARHW